MLQVFVDTECRTVSEHFQFAAVPRAGEIVFIQTKAAEIKLRVKVVEHYPPSKEDAADAFSPVTVQCEVVR